MRTPEPLKKGDKVAIISLSSGMLGEKFAAHEVEIGIRRLRAFGLEPVFTKHALSGVEFICKHPEARAADLKDAFLDPSIKGVITAIGGIDSFRTLPFLMEDPEFIRAVQEQPKLFLGYSDTTNSHLMFHRLGMQTFYGQAFITDLAELAEDMLPYSKEQFESLFSPYHGRKITPSEYWYEERESFSAEFIGKPPVSHREQHGFELLQGSPVFRGELLGGCIESMGDMLLSDVRGFMEAFLKQHPDQAGAYPSPEVFDTQGEIVRKYGIFPTKEEWQGKILFAETSELRISPERLRTYLEAFRAEGVFSAVSGMIVGKPIDECFYEEYKKVWTETVDDPELPILYNVNFGHGAPRVILPYGAEAVVNADKQEIVLL